MKYLWTEDTGAGLHFWQLINQLFFDNELAIESKESNQGILDALSDLEIKADDKYYIAFDYVVDNQDIRNKYRMLKSISEKSGGKVTILDMICFEYLILAFGKLVTWTGTGKADKIKIREDVLSAIEDHRINLSKIDDEKTLQYLAIGNDKNVKFQLAKNRNRNSFINNLKAIMQKEITSVDDDINELADLYFKKEDGIEKYKKMLISIRNKEDQKSLSKKTRDIITSIAEDSFARMIAFIPDDDLIVSYRPEKAKKFIPLSNASAGQKTTTILTFLLAYGNQPLLLDQPEDDLDNRLVYDLIVARLKVAKSKRQIIVVTHNANIPVNGDSEYIISMDSETDIIQVNQTGTMDDESIRQEICDVMEGTKDAFEMRAKKYHFNIKE